MSNLITDFIFGIVTLFYALFLFKEKKHWIACSFLFVGISAFLAGVWHGFHEKMPYTINTYLWISSMGFLFGFSLFMLLGTALLLLREKPLRVFSTILIIFKSILFISWYSYMPTSFLPPFYDYSLSFLIIFCLILWKIVKSHQLIGIWILSGIIMAFIAGYLWVIKIPSYPYFDHNDLFHILQLFSASLIFIGFKKIRFEIAYFQ